MDSDKLCLRVCSLEIAEEQVVDTISATNVLDWAHFAQLGLGRFGERGGGKDPDTAVLHLDGRRATTDRYDSTSSEGPASTFRFKPYTQRE